MLRPLRSRNRLSNSRRSMSWSFVENNDSAENGCGAEGCEGVLAVETAGGGNGAANSGAGNDDGGTEECDVGG